MTLATNDNRPHFALVTVVNGQARLHVDTNPANSTTAPTGVGTVAGLTIGGTLGATAVQVAWVGFSSAGVQIVRAEELATLATGGVERSDLRVARWLRWLGLGEDLVAEQGLSDVAYVATGDVALLDAVAEVNKVEGGVLFAYGDQLVFHSRNHRYNSPVKVEFTASDITGDGLDVQVDTARLLNDYYVSRPAGATYRARDFDSATTYGTRTRRDTLYTATDDDTVAAAEWAVGRWGSVAPYVPSISLNLFTLPDDVVGPAMGLRDRGPDHRDRVAVHGAGRVDAGPVRRGGG